MNYTTQMDAAKKGIITKEMETVASKEGMDVEILRNLIAEGKVVIPAYLQIRITGNWMLKASARV